MYVAHFYDYDLLGKRQRKIVEVSGETPLEFDKNMSNLNGPNYGLLGPKYTLRGARDCSIDGIKVKPGIFHKDIRDAVAHRDNKIIRANPPLHTLGFTPLESTLYGLKHIGKEISVGSPPKEKEFYDMMSKLYNYKVLTLYHGSKAESIGQILKNGFKVSRYGAFGKGLYVGPFEKAKGYNGKDGAKSSWHKKDIYGMVVEMDVLIGNCFHAPSVLKTIPAGYDSVYYTGFQRPEYCLRSANQVLIKRIIIL